MKAYDWSVKFNAAFNGEGDVFKTIEEFVKESVALIDQRTKNSKGMDFVKGATEGAVREAKNKWLSIQGRCPRLKSFGFDQIAKQIKKEAPDRCFRFVAA